MTQRKWSTGLLIATCTEPRRYAAPIAVTIICGRGLQCGSRAFTRNQKRINCALECVRDAERHSDDHDEGRGERHPRYQGAPAWVRRELLFEESP